MQNIDFNIFYLTKVYFIKYRICSICNKHTIFLLWQKITFKNIFFRTTINKLMVRFSHTEFYFSISSALFPGILASFWISIGSWKNGFKTGCDNSFSFSSFLFFWEEDKRLRNNQLSYKTGTNQNSSLFAIWNRFAYSLWMAHLLRFMITKWIRDYTFQLRQKCGPLRWFL